MSKSETVFFEGFESDEGWHHNCIECMRAESTPALLRDVEVGNIFVPKGWLFWFNHYGEWSQPEGGYFWKWQDHARVKSGNGAYRYFSFYRKHDAGLLRQIETIPGKQYRLTAHAHAWSNTNLEGHSDCYQNPRCSCGVGKGPVSLSDMDVPPLNGGAWNDAIGNFAFNLAVDLNGGQDIFARGVLWGDTAYNYNGYAEVPAVEFVAIGHTTTIFLRSWTLWPFEHNDAYWDDIKVELIDDELPEPPHSDYESTMLVLPQGATLDQLDEVMREAYPQRRTFGFSHDDAAALNGTAVLYNIPDDERENYVAWYEEHNPHVRVEFRYTDDFSQPALEWGKYQLLQRDFDETFGDGCPINTNGCYITCLAMAQNIYGIRDDATPVTVDEELGIEGYDNGCEARWSAVRERCGLRIDSGGDLGQHLAEGGVAMLELDFNDDPQDGMQQHFVLAVEENGPGDWLVLDPWNGTVLYSEWYTNPPRSHRLLIPAGGVVEPPSGPAGDDVSLHLQTMVGGSLEYIHAAQPRLTKVMGGHRSILDILGQNPNSVVVFRHVTNDYSDTLENPDPHQGARNWLAKFEDSLKQVAREAHARFPDATIVVESVNECVPSLNPTALQRLIDFDIAFIEELGKWEMPWVKPGVLNAAVGNPHESEFEMLLPLARACAAAGGFMDYHSYWRDNRLTSEYEYYSGRWTVMDEVFTEHGVFVNWYGGESGVYHTAADGWRAQNCYGGNWERYFQDIKDLCGIEREWNRNHANRKYSNCLFTSGDGVGWDSFQIRSEQMRAISGWLGE